MVINVLCFLSVDWESVSETGDGVPQQEGGTQEERYATS